MPCTSPIQSATLLVVVVALAARPHASLGAQPTVHHPVITSVSPRDPAPGQLVTITGSGFVVPSYQPFLEYVEKYGSRVPKRVSLAVTNTSLTFNAPSNLLPDSARVVFIGGSPSDVIPSSGSRISLPTIYVKHAPLLSTQSTDAVGRAVRSVTGTTIFRAMTAGALTIRGSDLLRVPSFTSDGGKASTTSPTALLGGPVVRFAGTTLLVQSADYVPFTYDNIVVNVPTLPHNTTGFLTISTAFGIDSTPLTFVRPPEISRIVDEQANPPLAVTTGVLEEGRRYSIRGANLIARTASNGVFDPLNADQVRLEYGSTGLPLSGVTSTGTAFVPRDSSIQFVAPIRSASPTPLTVRHVGGSATAGSYVVVAPPPVLRISGAVATPSDAISGATLTITVAFANAPADFSTAGSLIVSVSPALASVIDQPQPFPITSNPMIVRIPLKPVNTGVSGTLSIHHSSTGAASSTIPISVRPAHPTSISVSRDTVPGSTSATGTIAFDAEGQLTSVFLTSSDPTTLTVPSSVARTGSTVTFPIQTTAVDAPRAITINAAVDGHAASRVVVVRPGRLAGLTVSPSTVNADQDVTVIAALDAPALNGTVTFTSADTAVKPTTNSGTPTLSVAAAVSGTTASVSMRVSPLLLGARTVTLNASAAGATLTSQVSVVPLQISEFSLAPNTGAAGATLTATVRLAQPARTQVRVRVTSDSSFVNASAGGSLLFNANESVKIFAITLGSSGAVTKAATLTARIVRDFQLNSPIIDTKTATVTVTP